MKSCPFCAEEIQEAAIKCRFCGEFLDKKPGQEGQWLHKTSVLVIAFLCLGPLAIPLLWINPRYDNKKKITITVIVLLLSIVLVFVISNAVKSIKAYYDIVFQGM